jgi:hypothetical protein
LDPDEIDCFDEFHDKFGKYIAAAQDKGRWSKKEKGAEMHFFLDKNMNCMYNIHILKH